MHSTLHALVDPTGGSWAIPPLRKLRKESGVIRVTFSMPADTACMKAKPKSLPHGDRAALSSPQRRGTGAIVHSMTESAQGTEKD